MRKQQIMPLGLMGIVAFLVGCGQSTSTPAPPPDASSPVENSVMSETTTSPSQPPPLKPRDEAPAPGATDGAGKQPPESDDGNDVNDADEPPTSRRVAQVGDGKKGQGYGGGPISEPARTYFRVRERIIFAVQIPQAMKIYKAMNGQAPKTHDEFIEKIVNENGIKLPQLRDGANYVYDPEAEELMIERSGP